MPEVRILDPEFKPSEFPDARPGDVIDVTYADQLLAEGKVQLVTDTEGDVNICTDCGFVAKSATGLKTHSKKHA